MKSKKRTFFRLLSAALLPAALCLSSPSTRAAAPSAGPPTLQDTVFLGEAVPLQINGTPLKDLLAQRLPQEEGAYEFWWVSPEGPVGLERLGRQRPTADTEYQLSAVLHMAASKDAWVNLAYHVKVVSGTVRVRAEGREIGMDDQALVKLEGRGLTVYRRAVPEADPQRGVPALEAEFSGLPFGVYKLTVMTGGLSPEEAVCRVGVCEEDDTVSPDRRMALARFTANGGRCGALEENYRLRTGS